MNMQEIDITDSWSEISLGDVLKYEQPYKYAVNDSQFNAKSGTPVLTAGKSFILGYTNETSGIYLDLPVIIFDDFTTDCKYVDFPFKVKSSAMKFLKEKNKNEVDLKFMFEILQSVKLKTTGGDHKRRWISEYSKIKVKIPKYKEQTRIAQILSTADKAIEQTEKLIAKYQRIKAGLMQDLLAKGIDEHGRIRSKATHRFVVKNGIEVPEEWEVRELDEVANIIVSNVDKKTIEGEIKVILCNYMDVYSNTVISKSLPFMEASATTDEIERFTLNIGDVVITKDSETPDDIAVPAVVKDEIPRLICGYHLAIIRPKFFINGYYLMFQFLKHNAKLHFGSHATGSTRFGLSINSIKKFKIAIPDIKEQLHIEEKINSIEHLLQKETIYFSKLQSLKTGLMQDLLSGRVRVKLPETEHEKEKQNA